MRAFLLRPRWWLMGAMGLAILGTAASLLFIDLKRPDAFDRVQVGMKYLQAHRMLMDAGAEDRGIYPAIEKHTVRYASAYMLGNDFVEIAWDKDGKVYDKGRTRIGPSWPDRVLAWLAPIRAAVGL